jgi:hypothetical protein
MSIDLLHWSLEAVPLSLMSELPRCDSLDIMSFAASGSEEWLCGRNV